MELINGDGITIKLLLLVMVTPFTVIMIFPVEAPGGTVTVRLVAEASVTGAVTSLNITTLLAGVLLKLVPLMIIVAPTAPLNGLNPVMVGVGSTVKSEALRTVIPFNVRDIFPLVAPTGTVVVMLLEVEAVTTLEVPLNLT
jgi:hypothetical protein